MLWKSSLALVLARPGLCRVNVIFCAGSALGLGSRVRAYVRSSKNISIHFESHSEIRNLFDKFFSQKILVIFVDWKKLLKQIWLDVSDCFLGIWFLTSYWYLWVCWRLGTFFFRVRVCCALKGCTRAGWNKCAKFWKALLQELAKNSRCPSW